MKDHLEFVERHLRDEHGDNPLLGRAIALAGKALESEAFAEKRLSWISFLTR